MRPMIDWADANTPNIEVKNLQSSWKVCNRQPAPHPADSLSMHQDGRAFLALANALIPGANAAATGDEAQNLALAFDLFEIRFGVAQAILVINS